MKHDNQAPKALRLDNRRMVGKLVVIAGLKSQGPRALASNSTVISRDRSTCVLASICAACSGVDWPEPTRSETDSTLTPKASHTAR